MGPTAQVDVVVLQHLLNFWDSRNIDIKPIWKVLDIDATQPLPRWIAAESLSDVHTYLMQQGFGANLIVEAGQYLADQQLPLARLVACGESLRHSLPQCIRFAYLTVVSVQFDLDTHPQSRVVRITPVDLNSNSNQLLMALSCMCAATISGLGDSLQPGDLSLRLPHHIAEQSEIERAFSLPANADDIFALEISLSAWERINPAYNAAVFRSAFREAEREDQKFRDYIAIYDELKNILQQCLLERNVSQEDVAARIGISVRNLQRRLKALGTSYQSLLDEARQALTMKLICDESTPLYEISFLVGYTEPSAFYKAFKRWTGKTPGEYRLTLPTTESRSEELSVVSDEA